MVKATDSKHAPWYIVRSDDKRRARLNCIAHILSLIPHKTIRRKKAKLPKRVETKDTPICPRCAGGILCRSGTNKKAILPLPANSLRLPSVVGPTNRHNTF